MKFPYSFSLPPEPPQPKADAALVEHAYSEFRLNLPAHWLQAPTSEKNACNFHSEQDKATITVSADLYEIAEAKAPALAEHCLDSRHAALTKVSTGVTVLNRSIKAYSGGGALEMHLSAQLPDKQVYLYLGYVTSRKIFNFTLVCEPGNDAAAALFKQIMGNLRVLIP